MLRQQVEQSVSAVRQLIGLQAGGTLADLRRLCRVSEKLRLRRCAWEEEPRVARYGDVSVITLPLEMDEDEEHAALLHEVAHHHIDELNGGRQLCAGVGRRSLILSNDGRDEAWVQLWMDEWRLPYALMYGVTNDSELLELAGGDGDLLHRRLRDRQR